MPPIPAGLWRTIAGRCADLERGNGAVELATADRADFVTVCTWRIETIGSGHFAKPKQSWRRRPA